MPVATYQGIPCLSVQFRRSRGYAADSTIVTMLASAVGVDVKDVAELSRPETEGEVVLDVAGPLAGDELPGRLKPEGVLVMAQANAADGDALKVATNLFVAKVETVRDLGGGRSPAEASELIVRLTLVDERFFWTRGVLARWSFNRGTPDSEEGGKALPRKTILAEHVLPRLFRGYAPATDSLGELWNRDPETEFPPWSPAVVALSKMVADTGAAPPCLRLDSELALHDQGDGFRGDDGSASIGYAPDGKGKNSQPVPIEALEDAGGRGRSFTAEPQYPEDYAIVTCTSPTIATCAVDDWEPVLMIGARPYLLSEQLVRRLTDGRFGLEWLQRFVMLPASEQGNVYLQDNVLELLRKQAYRFWRLPGVETIGEDPEQSGTTPDSPPAEDENLGGFYTGAPGPNAHMLPLLARAERVSGKRLPVTVETYRWQVVRKKFEGNDLQRKVAELRSARRDTEELIEIAARQKQVKNPLTFPPRPDALEQIAQGLGDAVGIGAGVRARTVKVLKTSEIMTKEGLALDRGLLGKSMSMARAQEAVTRDVDPALGQTWEERYKQQLAAEDEINGTGSLIYYELAKQIVALESRAREEQASLLEDLINLQAKGTLKEAFRPYREVAGQLMGEAVKKLANLQEEQQIRQATGQENAASVTLATALRNMPRAEDPGAAVVSAELGVVRTSGLAGHVRDVRVARAQLTSLKPTPVRVLFGAVLRPRIDKAPSNRAPTGVTRGADGVLRVAAPRGGNLETRGQILAAFLEESEEAELQVVGGQNEVPVALDDKATFYAAAFKRVGKGSTASAERLKIPDLTAEQLQQAKGMSAPGALLVPLVGTGNERELFENAERLALGAFRRPERLEDAEVTLIGPWPIQCDGKISSVSISLAEGSPSYRTTVAIGSRGATPNGNVTRVRVPSLADGLRRQGLLP